MNKLNANGQKEGYWEETDIYGLLSKKYYSNNVLNGLFEDYFPNGQLRRRILFKYGIRNGISEEYLDDGRLDNRLVYKDDKPHGFCESYWWTGEVYYKGVFKDGLESGFFIEGLESKDEIYNVFYI